MPVKRRKDLSRCVGRGKFKLPGAKRHYWHIFLWEDKAAMLANVVTDGPEDNRFDACHCCEVMVFDASTDQPCPRPKMGELHFLKGRWDMEVVAHEVLHAIFHSMRQVEPIGVCIVDPFEGIEESTMPLEEVVCYRHGVMVQSIYKWLWELDPAEKWERKEG